MKSRIPEAEVVVPESIRRLTSRLEKLAIVGFVVIIAILIFSYMMNRPKPIPKSFIPILNPNYINFIRESNPKLSPEEISVIIEIAVTCGKISELGPEIHLSIPKVESDFNPRALSSEGARGLNQIHSGSWRDANFLVKENMTAGCRKFVHYYTVNDNNVVPALMAYRSGTPDGAGRRKGKTKAEIEKKKFESRQYVDKVLDYAYRLGQEEWKNKNVSPVSVLPTKK